MTAKAALLVIGSDTPVVAPCMAGMRRETMCTGTVRLQRLPATLPPGVAAIDACRMATP